MISAGHFCGDFKRAMRDLGYDGCEKFGGGCDGNACEEKVFAVAGDNVLTMLLLGAGADDGIFKIGKIQRSRS